MFGSWTDEAGVHPKKEERRNLRVLGELFLACPNIGRLEVQAVLGKRPGSSLQFQTSVRSNRLFYRNHLQFITSDGSHGFFHRNDQSASTAADPQPIDSFSFLSCTSVSR